MKKNNINKKGNQSKKLFLNTQLILLFLTSALIALVSIVLYGSDNVPLNGYFYIITAILAISDFSSGFYVGIKLKKNGMLNALIHCMPVNLIYLLVSTFINSFKVDFTILFSFIIAITSSMLGGIFSVNYKSKIKHKRVGT